MNVGGIGYTGFTMRNAGIKPKSSSVSGTNSTVSKLDVAAFSSANTKKEVEAGKSRGSTMAQATLNNASQEVQDAWKKAEEECGGFNPLTDADGKIAGSSLLARHMEMEYNLMLRYGAKEARIRMNNVFADKDSAKSLISAALERVNNPLTRDKSSAQLGFEKKFFESFLSLLG
ncbi:hypothetical protein P4H61_01380 [Paenibacillus peoriae]|uniref:hypothetical protein n=1 Tax=Paenibacillus peoriae TaxID=59893 RepID=UPI00026C5ACA|nr:hypothetical protein [Paenibacillus peoriae]MEC0180150.1 hypothetical protein [Paenibacillus peoriae]